MNIGLPNNLTLEVEVLSMIMNNEYCLNESMDKLSAKDFYDTKNSTLFETKVSAEKLTLLSSLTVKYTFSCTKPLIIV